MRPERRFVRAPELGFYFIVTDTKETEQNYFYGLRDSIPRELQRRLVIKVAKTRTRNLLEEAQNLQAVHPQYGEPWIVFDRDQVEDFDEIIAAAEEKGIHVGWTNPCIEEWFAAYFGPMPPYRRSVECCGGFSRIFEMRTGQKYDKADPKIYEKLKRFGNEEAAIDTAEKKLMSFDREKDSRPSKMSPCTTVHRLVAEIRRKSNAAGAVS